MTVKGVLQAFSRTDGNDAGMTVTEEAQFEAH